MLALKESNDERLRIIIRHQSSLNLDLRPRIFFANPKTYEEQFHNAKLEILGGVRPQEFDDMHKALQVWEDEMSKPNFKV